METRQLLAVLIQPDILWKNTMANLEKYSDMLKGLNERCDLVLLPEMFNTGFCTDPEFIAEDMDGETIQWMTTTAKSMNLAIAGSIIIKQHGRYFNRLICANPTGEIYSYNKRHLFRMAGEEAKFTPGQKQLIVKQNEWRIAFQICYDLRFPVWSRNRNDYDVLVYLSNWPAARSDVWNILLRARAIENQCYVIGVNRVGTDGNGIFYSGESMVISPKGTVLGAVESPKEGLGTYAISMRDLNDFRAKFPIWKDWDEFELVKIEK
jgi:omega-amidase